MKRTLKRELKGLEIAEREAVGLNNLSASVRAGGTRLGGGTGAPIGSPLLKPLGCALARTEGKCLRMLTKWLQPTRLETRTKESNIYASTRAETPCAY